MPTEDTQVRSDAQDQVTWRYTDQRQQTHLLDAEIGLYLARLSHDGECWSWHLEYIGACDTPEQMVDEASGRYAGDEAGAKARAEKFARMLSAHVEPTREPADAQAYNDMRPDEGAGT